MSVEERRGLNGRADTQALLGDRVRVVRLGPHWARVVVPSQPSPGRRGYPGWVPRRQLTAAPPVVTDRVATVLRRTTWVRDDSDGHRLYRISFGTRLPVLAEQSSFIRAASPTGRALRLAATAVTVHDRGDPALAPSRASVARTARAFLGLPYLWAGASGFGLDCSGLTWLTYGVHGIRIPRDASPQSQEGLPVTQPRRADLLFYATSGLVNHVALSVGSGRMVHAPGTGEVVSIAKTSASPYAEEYAGSRRYVP